MEEDRNEKILRYHYEEIVLILIILAYDLKKYSDDDLSSFSEAIEGRVEVLFRAEFLSKLEAKNYIPEGLISKFEDLKNNIVRFYESGWMKKLLKQDKPILAVKRKALEILIELKIEENDANKYSDSHLNINW